MQSFESIQKSSCAALASRKFLRLNLGFFLVPVWPNDKYFWSEIEWDRFDEQKCQQLSVVLSLNDLRSLSREYQTCVRFYSHWYKHQLLDFWLPLLE